MINIITLPGKDLNPNCGGIASIEWDFELGRKAPCDGFIVQQIEVRCRIDPCLDCPTASPAKPNYSYWEAWFVHEGETLEINRIAGLSTYTDRAAFSVPKGKCGLKVIYGLIGFFCETTTNDLIKLWKNRGPFPGGGPRDSESSPGSLPATDKKPRWWNDAAIESDARSFTVYFNCCGGCGQYVNVTANPD